MTSICFEQIGNIGALFDHFIKFKFKSFLKLFIIDIAIDLELLLINDIIFESMK
jgi:hypothetical protein